MIKRTIYITKTITEYDDCQPAPPDPVMFTFRLGDITIKFEKGKTLEMQLTLPDDSQVGFVLPKTGLDARGNATNLKTPPTVSVSDPALLKIVQPDPATPDDAFTGVLSAVGPLGSAQFIVKDEDESTQPLMAIVDVQIVGGELVSLGNITFGEITKQPVAPTPPVDAPIVPEPLPS